MPKLLKIGAALNCGAPGRIAEQIGLLAKSKGWDVYHAHGVRHANPTQLNEITVGSKTEEYFHALQSILFDRHGLGSKNATERLVEQIKQIQPDIIHLHNLHGYFLNFKILFEYLATIDTPVIWTMHDCWVFTGRCSYFTRIDCYKWMTGCFDCKAEPGYTVSHFYDRSKELYELKKQLFTSIKNMILVPVSEWLGGFLKDSYLAKYPMQVIYNGVNTNKFVKGNNRLWNQLDIDNSKIVVLGVASPWNERKGLNDYIRLSEYANLQVVMVGVDTTMRKLLPSNIITISRTSSVEKLAEYYSMADVVTSLSYGETFGMTIAESLACGTPCVVYNNTAQPEIVSNETGRIVETGNIAEVYRNIIELVDQTSSIHEKCRNRALKEFDEETQFMKYIDLYNNLLSNK